MFPETGIRKRFRQTKTREHGSSEPTRTGYRSTVHRRDRSAALALHLTHDLSFSEHINNMVFKAHQRANAILRCFVSRNITLLLRAYLVYVRPLLEYNSTIWSPHYKYDIDAVERTTAVYKALTWS